MVVKKALGESTGVRRTRSGDILVELKAGVKGADAALKMKEVTGDRVCVSSLQSTVSVEIKDIDPRESMEKLKQDIVNGLVIKDASVVEVKSLTAVPWGAQTAIAVIPASYISGKEFVTKEGNKEPWGIVYKTVLGKIRREEAVSTLRTPHGETSTWQSTAEALLTALLPEDQENTDTVEQAEIRREMDTLPNVENAAEFNIGELVGAVKRLKRGKCPGTDLIEVEVIQRAWGVLHQEILRTMNACLAWGTFQRIWKEGNLITIPKGPDRDRSSPKSYRPICLLSMVGKLLERLMAAKLTTIFHDHELTSDRQYGFRPGRSTTDAILQLREKAARMSDRKYVLAIALDISGAFDNVWWPNVLHELKRRRCPDNLYKLTRCYFRDRTVQIAGKNDVITRPVTKGCPQGSVLGPSFWNLVFDDLLDELTTHAPECEPIAYADDLVILVAGNSRVELQKAGQEAVTRVSNWCTRKKLELSASKTEMLLIKGKLDAERPPIIKIDGRSIRGKQSIRYLGVYFESGFKINKHTEETIQKARNLLSSREGGQGEVGTRASSHAYCVQRVV